MIKLEKHQRNYRLVLKLGKYWVSIDHTGIMTWNGKRNHFYIFNK